MHHLSNQALADLNTTAESLSVEELHNLLFLALDDNRMFRYIAAEYIRKFRHYQMTRVAGTARAAQEVRQGLRDNLHSPRKADAPRPKL